MGDGVLSQDEINALLSGGIPDAPAGEPSSGGGGELSEQEIDTIGEVANISMGTAATTLFSLVNKKVDISTPVVSLACWNDIVDEYEKPCVLIKISYTKGLNGSNVLVLSEHDVKVITDLMMEGTDGFAVCSSLRNSLGSSHIPVIVLSGDVADKVKALESGANVFIEKPFQMDYLLMQIEGLLRMQEEMREHYSKIFVVEPSKMVISSMDEALLSRAMENIEKNMDNNDYDVDAFVYDMAVGRTILYQKIKDIQYVVYQYQ